MRINDFTKNNFVKSLKNKIISFCYLGVTKHARPKMDEIEFTSIDDDGRCVLFMDYMNEPVCFDFLNLFERLKTDETVHELRFEHIFIGRDYEDIKCFSDMLKVNTAVTALTITLKTGYPSKFIRFLAKALKINTTIKKFTLSNIAGLDAFEKPERDIEYILDALCFNTSIQILDLGNNVNIGENEEHMKCLGRLIETNNTIQELYLNDNNLCFSTKSLCYFCRGMKNNTTIKTLNLMGNPGFIEFPYTNILSNMLVNNTTIEKLDMRGILIDGCDPNEDEFLKLVKVLSANKTITTLKLGQNCIGYHPGDMAALSILLENTTVKNLELGMNFIGHIPGELTLFSGCLRANSILQTLDLRYNVVITHPEELPYFLETVCLHGSLQTLRLDLTSEYHRNYGGNAQLFTSKYVDIVLNNLKQNNRLTKLRLMIEVCDFTMLKQFFEVLQINTTLKSLDIINYNFIDIDNSPSLLGMGCMNTTIHHIGIAVVPQHVRISFAGISDRNTHNHTMKTTSLFEMLLKDMYSENNPDWE